MSEKPGMYDNVEACVDDVIASVGRDIRLGMPIGVGKPNLIANELYRRAKDDSSLKLTMLSGLTLAKPAPGSDLEKRFLGPILERVFGDYVDPAWIGDVKRGKLPDNVEIIEFFLPPAAFLSNKHLQQYYISSNYTHVARDLIELGVNVAAATVAKKQIGGRTMYSLGCNADATTDLMWESIARRGTRNRIELVAQTNARMPFMYGSGVEGEESFDRIVDNPALDMTLFGPPHEPVSSADYLIGLYVSTLVRDGGTLQIGIGSIGDAIAQCLIMRHRENDVYVRFAGDFGATGPFAAAVAKYGGTDVFSEGLYGCTEMMTEGFLKLYENGIIKKKVYGNSGIQRLVSEGKLAESGPYDAATIELLLSEKVLRRYLDDDDFEALRPGGLFSPGMSVTDGEIYMDGVRIAGGDLADEANVAAIAARCFNDRLDGGAVIHAGFMMGAPDFYQAFHDMPDDEKQLIQMREISYINQLYGDERLKILQRPAARFVNTGLMATMNGAVVSDGLENNQVLSGVGGQYNFVAMAHALPDAKSIIMVRSTRTKGGDVTSNIVWNYGHITIPRHLRDVVVTEYGIADLRGRTDRDVFAALLNVTDSRFQESLLAKARSAGKVAANYRIPDAFRNNLPETIEKKLRPYKEKGYFPVFPFGTELTDVELTLARALKTLKASLDSKKFRLPGIAQIGKIGSPPAAAAVYLERMKLDRPSSAQEKVLQKLMLYALATTGAF